LRLEIEHWRAPRLSSTRRRSALVASISAAQQEI
jgi:hypothetical protein